jgi:hypothetical protein
MQPTQPEVIQLKEKVDWKKFIPFSGALIIFFGFTYTYIYYKFFKIDILYYLDFSEIITLFLDTVLAIIVAMGYVILFYLDNIRNYFYVEGTKKKKVLAALGGFALAYGGFFFVMVIGKSDSFLGWMTFLFYFVAVWLSMFALFQNYHGYEPFFRMANAFFVGLVLVSYMGVREFVDVSHKKKYFGVTMLIDNNANKIDTLVSDSTKYFIGNSKNFLFVHDEKGNQTFVYPMSRIKEIIFKKNKYKDVLSF